MSEQVMHVVQQFERQGKRLVAGRQMPFKSSREAIGRAERDAARCAGVVAVQTTIDTESGEILDEPIILARFVSCRQSLLTRRKPSLSPSAWHLRN